MLEFSTPYWNHSIPAFHRLLGNLNRLPGSPLEGSFSRDAWLYRFGFRFHPSTRQCAFYPLSRLYKEKRETNPFHGCDAIFRYVCAAVSFTCSLQNGDGSFSEWYRGQPSFCATAYLAAYLSETFLLLSNELSPAIRDRAARTLRMAASWIGGRTSGDPPGNQAAAALLSLHNCSSIFGSDWKKPAAETRDTLARHLSSDGWIPEYGGPDLGYQSLSLDFLTRCADRGMAGLEEPIRKGLHFLELFVMPDGSSPASLSWRGTNFLMPFAIERWSPDSASARRLAPRVRQAIASGLLPTPSTVDDRYAAHFFLPSFIDAHFGMSSSPSPRGIEETRIEPDPSKCGGLYVAEGEEFRTCVQARKGGVAVHANGLRKVIWDAPTYCLRSRGKLFMPASSEAYRLLPHSEYSWESTFRRVREEDAAVKVGAGLLPFSHLVGGRRLPWLSGKIEARVKRAAFEPGEKAPVRIRRHIRFSPDEVSIRDLVEASGPYPSRLVSCHWTAPTNSPSSLFFSAAEQGPACALEEKTRAAVAGEWESQGRVESEIVITKSGHGTTVRSTVNGRDLYEEEVGARLFY